MGRWTCLALACVVALSACKREGGTTDAGPKGVASPPSATVGGGLVEPGEDKALEAALLAELKSVTPVSCVRTVLRGEPTPGSAAPDLLAIARSGGALAGCLDLFRTKESDALARGVLVRARGPNEPKRFIPESRPRTAPMPAVAREGAASVREACAGLQAAATIASAASKTAGRRR